MSIADKVKLQLKPTATNSKAKQSLEQNADQTSNKEIPIKV